MKFRVKFFPDHIQVMEADSVMEAFRSCMVFCKRYGFENFMIIFSSENDKKKKYEYMVDMSRKVFILTIRYAGAPLPLRCQLCDLDMDLSFLDDVKPFEVPPTFFGDDLPF